MIDSTNRNAHYSISGLANLAQVTRETIKFYTRKGLLNQHLDPVNGCHYYIYEDVNLIRFILKAKRTNMTIIEIAIVLKKHSQGELKTNLHALELCTMLQGRRMSNNDENTSALKTDPTLNCLRILIHKNIHRVTPYEWAGLLVKKT